MYLCQSCLGPGAYQVSVSHGYMVCACACVAWLPGLRACRMVTRFAPVRVSLGYTVCLALARPRVARYASFNAVAFLVIFINYMTDTMY